MLGFIYFEGEALRVLVRHMGYPAKRSHGFVYSAADVYFSAITPSASGGQPASAYFMLKDGIAGTAVMAALLLNLIMYTLAILTIGLVDILIFPEVFLNSRAWDYLLSSAEKAGIDRICRYLFCPDFTDDSLWEACR